MVRAHCTEEAPDLRQFRDRSQRGGVGHVVIPIGAQSDAYQDLTIRGSREATAVTETASSMGSPSPSSSPAMSESDPPSTITIASIV